MIEPPEPDYEVDHAELAWLAQLCPACECSLCLAHLVPEPCPTCSAYIAAGL